MVTTVLDCLRNDNYSGGARAITEEQAKLVGMPWPKFPGWKDWCATKEIEDKYIAEFKSFDREGRRSKRNVVLVPFDERDNDYVETYQEPRKTRKQKYRNKDKQLRSKVTREIVERVGNLNERQIMDKSFYKSQQWLTLRYSFLRESDGRCACCGASKKDGVVMHVDHIVPRSVNWMLALCFQNLQLLCEDCNRGKTNIFSDDWRNDGKVLGKVFV